MAHCASPQHMAHSLPLCIHGDGKEVVLPRRGVAVQQGDGGVTVVTRVMDEAVEAEAMLGTGVQQCPCTSHRVVLGVGVGVVGQSKSSVY